MKKFLLKLRMASRNMAILLLLLIQLALPIAAYFLLSYLEAAVLIYYLVALVLYIMSIVFVVKIIYSQEDPEFRIPWLFVLLVIPVVGVIIYLIFKQKGLRYRQRKMLNDIREAWTPYFKDKITNDKRYDTSDNQPIAFLENVADFNAHKNNRVTYYKCGEEFFPALIKALEEAKEFIFMEFFIIRDGQEWEKIHDVLKRKAQEGVEIRLLYDDFGCFKYLPAYYARELRKEGIQAYRFNKVGIFLRGSYNNRSHRKIAVIDHKYGFTGGMNLGDEYANVIHEFGYWKDAMVRVEGSCINNMIALFLQNYDLNRRQISDYAKYLNYTYPIYDSNSLIYFFGTGPEMITPIRVGEQNYVNIIETATKSLYISTPYLIPSLDLMHALERAALRGVDVHLIVPGIPDKKLVYLVAKFHFQPLLQSGVKIYTYTPGFNHMKAMLADDSVAFVGTINMDYRSLVHHFECGLTLVHDPILKEMKLDFEKMVNESQRVPQDAHLNGGQKVVCALLRLFMPLL